MGHQQPYSLDVLCYVCALRQQIMLYLHFGTLRVLKTVNTLLLSQSTTNVPEVFFVRDSLLYIIFENL